MITLNCDNCERDFQVEDDAAGQKVTCPYCGDVNRVQQDAQIATQRPSPSQPAAAIHGKPSRASAPEVDVSAANSAQDERVLRVVRTAMFRAHPYWYTLMVLLVPCGLAVVIGAAMLHANDHGMSEGSPPIQDTRYAWLVVLGFAISAAAPLWWLIWWAAPHRWVKLTITDRRSIRQEGIVMRKTSEVLHNHIRNVKIEQGVLQRLLNVGTIAIDSAGGSDDEPIEIVMHSVPKPYEIKRLIDQHRRM